MVLLLKLKIKMKQVDSLPLSDKLLTLNNESMGF
jgi:hypothetical protein